MSIKIRYLSIHKPTTFIRITSKNKSLHINMNVKIKSKLGSGLMGTVYLSEIDLNPAITKIEKYDGDLTTKSYYARQLMFNEVAKKCPEHFTTLISSGIIENCAHKQKLKFPIHNVKIKKLMKERENWDKCSILSYTPVLTGTFESIRDKITDKQFLDVLYQLINACNFLKKNHYRHRDIHGENIMYNVVKGKYKWYLIDYGTIYHDSFIKNYDDEVCKDNPPDIISLLWAISNDRLAHYMYKNKIPIPPPEKIAAYIKKDARYASDIKPYLPNIKNSFILNECICLITLIKHYDLYMDAFGMDSKIYKKYMTTQRFPEIFLYIIKHCTDESYDIILRYIKRKKD